MITKLFYLLFKTFPYLAEKAADANRQIYDEYLDTLPDSKESPSPFLAITHDDGPEPEEE